VMLTDLFPAQLPPLEDVRNRVTEDYQIEQQFLSRRAAEDNLVENYELVVEEI